MTAEELKSSCYSKEAVLCTMYPCQSLTINLSFRDQGLGFRVQGSGFNVDPVLIYPRLHRDYTRDPHIKTLRRRGVIRVQEGCGVYKWSTPAALRCTGKAVAHTSSRLPSRFGSHSFKVTWKPYTDYEPEII